MFIIAWVIWSLSIMGLLAIPAIPIRSRREVEALRGNSSGNTVATSYSKNYGSKYGVTIIPGRQRP